MGEENGKGLWIGLTAFAAIAAAVFLVLWYMRGGDIDRLTTELGTSQASVRRLESDLNDARRQADSSSRRASELESQAQRETRLLAETSGQLERRLRSDLDFSEQRLATATAELENLRESGEAAAAETTRLREELEQAGRELADARSAKAKADADASAASELADLRNELTQTTLALSEAKSANAALEEARGRLAAGVDGAKATAMSRERELMGTIEELTARIDSQPQRDSSALDSVKRELDSVKREFESFRNRASAVAKAADEAWRARLAAAERELDALRAAQPPADPDALPPSNTDKGKETGNESARQIILLRNAFTRQGEILKETTAKYEKEKEALQSTVSKLEKALADVSPGGPKFAPFPIGRSVGKILDRIADGQILLVEGGVNQRMRPGMKFDAFRPIGEGTRYAGMIKIVRALEDHSMAVSSYAEVDSLTCPVTGRAVLDPGAKYSPYAVDGNGMPVKLKPAGKVGIPLEAPAIGDLIDNPFYEPARQVRFAIDPGLADDPCVAATIEALGGVVRSGDLAKDADFTVVENANSESGAPASGPRRVAIGHLARYLDPSPAE